MILNDYMIEVKSEIENKGYYRITALNTSKQRIAIQRMFKCGMIIIKNRSHSHIDFVKNWK